MFFGESSRLLKIVSLVLFIAILGVLVRIILMQKGILGTAVPTQTSSVNVVLPAQDGKTSQSTVLPQGQNIFGIVEGVSGQTITLRVTAPAATGTKTIEVDEATIINKIVVKDRDTFQKETAAFRTLSKDAARKATVPLPFKRLRISLGDIRNGDTLMVTSTQATITGNTIKAAVIILQPTPPSQGDSASVSK